MNKNKERRRKVMKDRVVRTIVDVENNNWTELLRGCAGVKERYEKLTELVPQTMLWSPMAARQLVFYLHHKYQIDFGVCQHYSMDDDRQYCCCEPPKTECLCVIPQSFCVFRDRNGKPKHPEFLPFQIEELERQFREALSIVK